MRALLAAELLDVWERGLGQSPTARALTLLSAACPEVAPEALARLSVGDRDTRLMTLRKWTFGGQLVCVATCAGCGERLELSFGADDVFTEEANVSMESFSLAVEDYELNFRLPNSLDLAELAKLNDPEAGRALLLDRCVAKAEQHGKSVSISEVPAYVLESLVTRMGEIDKTGNLQLMLSCPQCAQSSPAIFDIESFFWKEINAWAIRMLREVHKLASAYGWREMDILNMTAWRRQVYLNLIGA
jgi:hypothetical protein